MSQSPAGVFADIPDAGEDTGVCYKNFVMWEALLGEEGFEVLMDGGEEALKVVSIGMMVAVVEPKVFDGIWVGTSGAEHGDRGAVRPGWKCMHMERRSSVLQRIFMTPLEVECAELGDCNIQTKDDAKGGDDIRFGLKPLEAGTDGE